MSAGLVSGARGTDAVSTVGGDGESIVYLEELLASRIRFVIVKVSVEDGQNEIAADAVVEGVHHAIPDPKVFKIPQLQSPEISTFLLLRDPRVHVKIRFACESKIFDGQGGQQVLAALHFLEQRIDIVFRMRVIPSDLGQVLLGGGMNDYTIDDTLGGITRHTRARLFERGSAHNRILLPAAVIALRQRCPIFST